MRKVLLILFLLFLLALAPVGAANFPEANAKQVAVKITNAREQLKEKERNGGKVVETLLEAILVTSPPPTSPTSHTSPTGK